MRDIRLPRGERPVLDWLIKHRSNDRFREAELSCSEGRCRVVIWTIGDAAGASGRFVRTPDLEPCLTNLCFE